MSRHLVRIGDQESYSPANHSGTSNVRVIGRETVGATALEVLIGTIRRGHGAQPHAHPFLEQCSYLLCGDGESEIEGHVVTSRRGTWSYLPQNAFHSFRVTSDEPVKVLVVYSPPYGENPKQTVTTPGPRRSVEARRLVFDVPDLQAKATGVVPIIDAESAGAKFTEVLAWQLGSSSLLLRTEHAAEQVIYLQRGAVGARVGDEEFEARSGDFLFVPRGIEASLESIGEVAGGFLIKGRMVSG